MPSDAICCMQCCRWMVSARMQLCSSRHVIRVPLQPHSWRGDLCKAHLLVRCMLNLTSCSCPCADAFNESLPHVAFAHFETAALIGQCKYLAEHDGRAPHLSHIGMCCCAGERVAQQQMQAPGQGSDSFAMLSVTPTQPSHGFGPYCLRSATSCGGCLEVSTEVQCTSQIVTLSGGHSSTPSFTCWLLYMQSQAHQMS